MDARLSNVARQETLVHDPERPTAKNKQSGWEYFDHSFHVHTYISWRSFDKAKSCEKDEMCYFFVVRVVFGAHMAGRRACSLPTVSSSCYVLFFFLCLARCRLIEKPSLFRICCFVIVLRVWAWNCLCTCTPNVSKWPASLLFSIFSQFEHPTKFDIRTCTAQRARCVFRGIYSTVPK